MQVASYQAGYECATRALCCAAQQNVGNATRSKCEVGSSAFRPRAVRGIQPDTQASIEGVERMQHRLLQRDVFHQEPRSTLSRNSRRLGAVAFDAHASPLGVKRERVGRAPRRRRRTCRRLQTPCSGLPSQRARSSRRPRHWPRFDCAERAMTPIDGRAASAQGKSPADWLFFSLRNSVSTSFRAQG